MKTTSFIITVLIFLMQPLTAMAASKPVNWRGRVTTYYSNYGKGFSKFECGMEGNQIDTTTGKLIGSNCRAYTARYCPWGVGTDDTCIAPCVHAAGPFVNGTRVNVPAFRCPWGPLKGKMISQVIIADKGPEHIDLFVGLCAKKEKNMLGFGTGECERFAPPTAIASYNGFKGKEQKIAAAFMDRFVKGAGTQWFAALNPPPAPVQTAAHPSVDEPPTPVLPSLVPPPVSPVIDAKANPKPAATIGSGAFIENDPTGTPSLR